MRLDIDFNKIERRWQKVWEDKKLFIPTAEEGKPKYFNFDSAPFPNGGLHLGHARNYVLGDIVARYKRACGFNVLYSTNFDSFGLPNQIAAEKSQKSPEEFTLQCISIMKRDLKRLGISYDWSRVNSTSDPEYYRWTQWLFLELYSAGLVYRKESDVNWCNDCATVLAHLEVKDRRCERCGNIVVNKRMPQWFIALTEYSEDLLSTVNNLEGWSDRAKNLLKGFIGETTGSLIPFNVLGSDKTLDVFLPNDYCLEDVAFVGMAADWTGAEEIYLANNIDSKSISHQLQINPAISPKRNSLDYASRIGIDSGVRLKHPSLGLSVPLLVVNYLSGKEGPPVKAGVPASDKIDKCLANELSLPELNSQQKSSSVKTIKAREIKAREIKTREISYYYVHDWMVSRQKKWGTPLPFIECQNCGLVPVPEADLPVINRSGESLTIMCPSCSGSATNVEDTLDCYLDDVWCFLSTELHSKDDFSLERAGSYGWFPADQYHAGYDIYMYLHLYRFIARFLFNRGCLDTPEPIRVHYGHDMVLQNNRKMSKRHNNTNDINLLINEYGADVVRLSIMLAANPGKPIVWNDEHLFRAKKQLSQIIQIAVIFSELRPSNVVSSEYQLSVAIRNSLKNKSKKLIKSITNYIESYRPATCIQYIEQHIGELNNVVQLFRNNNIRHEDYYLFKNCFLTFCILLSPFAPHVVEEVWEMIGGEKLASQAKWPS